MNTKLSMMSTRASGPCVTCFNKCGPLHPFPFLWALAFCRRAAYASTREPSLLIFSPGTILNDKSTPWRHPVLSDQATLRNTTSAPLSCKRCSRTMPAIEVSEFYDSKDNRFLVSLGDAVSLDTE